MGKVHHQILTDVQWHSAACSMVLNAGEVHVYRININAKVQQLDAFKTTLTPAETERGNKYYQLKDRQRFVVSRGAQRAILGRYLNTPPAALTFLLGENKKPYLSSGDGDTIRYNITHAGDWILLAICQQDVGADVELIDPEFRFREILEDNFSKAEIKYISEAHQTERFFLLWTRKEALLKATGQGLGDHLQSTPSLDGYHTLPGDLTGAENNWQVSSFILNDNYWGSIAAEANSPNLLFFDAAF